MFSCCFQHPERNLPGAAFDSKTVLVFGMRQQQINESTNQLLNNKSTISKKLIFAAHISIVLPQIRSLIYKEERRD